MKPVYIYLDKDAELAELIEVLRQQKAKDFVVVAPERARLFAHPLNIEILSREVKALDKNVMFDTGDVTGRRLVEGSGFEIVGAKEEKEGKVIADIHRPSRPGKTAEPPAPEKEHSRQRRKHEAATLQRTVRDTVMHGKGSDEFIEKFYKERESVALETEEKKSESFVAKHKSLIIFIVSALVLLGASFGVTTWYLGRAKIVITAMKSDHPLEYTVTLDANSTAPDTEKRILPVQRIEIEKLVTKSYPATGADNISTRARGTITIVNNYSTAPQTLIATTRFQDVESGKIFRLVKQVTVPGKSSTTAEVAADQPGEEYNIPAGRLTIPAFKGTARFSAIYGLSEQPMSGGFKGWSKFVTAEDAQNGERDVLADARAAVDAERKMQYGTLMILDDLAVRKDEIVMTSPRIGEPGDEVVLTARGTLSALGINEEVLRDFISALEKQALAEDEELKDMSLGKMAVKSFNFSKGQATFVISGNSLFAKTIDVDRVKSAVSGKTIVELKTILGAFSNIEKVDVSLWPFWINKVPEAPGRISVVVQ